MRFRGNSVKAPKDKGAQNPGGLMSINTLVIVGGVAGGIAAAARARRLNDNIRIIVLERGPYVSFANCGLPYHISGEVPDRNLLLVNTPENLRSAYSLDVRVNSDVIAIDPQRKSVTVRNLLSGEEYAEAYGALLLAPGASAFRPSVAGINDKRVFTLRNLVDLDHIMEGLHEGTRRVAVVGAGYIGLEVVEACRKKGLDCMLVERLPHMLTALDPEMTSPLYEELRRQRVAIHLGDGLKEFMPGASLDLCLESGACIAVDMAILALGVRPETSLAEEAGLKLALDKAILVDEQQRTSDPHIFAVGDAVRVRGFVDGGSAYIPLAGPAVRQARIAADAILGLPGAYRGSQGTAICRVFSLTAGSTGLNEQQLKRLNIPYVRLYTHSPAHASYFPGATPISFKLLFSPANGKILGAQAIGSKGVDKRLDVLSMAVQAGMGIHDLAEAELCYSPPYGSVKDPVNILGMTGQNLLAGLLRLIEPEDVNGAVRQGAILVDVREPEELASGTLPYAVNLPLSRLRRDAEKELPKDKEILLCCQVGMRGYTAQRFMEANGWRTRNVNGGYMSWRMAQVAGMFDR